MTDFAREVDRTVTSALNPHEHVIWTGHCLSRLGKQQKAQRFLLTRSDDEMYCRKQTVYVLTNKRAFVLKHCRTKIPMRSITWRFVDEVRAEEVGSDGRGTVRFWRWDSDLDRWTVALQFYRVGNASQVAVLAKTAMTQENG